MADRVESEEDKRLNLRGSTIATDRGSSFWNTSTVEMKFSVERSWIKSVRNARNKPSYGMTDMDSQLEEVIGNKLELVGPLVDSFLREIGKLIFSKLSRSKATGLASPICLFFPWPVFRHVLTFVQGYSGDVSIAENGSKISTTISERRSIKKLFSPSWFSGENYTAYRHFKKVPSKSGKKLLSVYNGRSTVVVTKNTPFTMSYAMKSERVTVTFFIQRYNSDDFPLDTSLQALMNRSEGE